MRSIRYLSRNLIGIEPPTEDSPKTINREQCSQNKGDQIILRRIGHETGRLSISSSLKQLLTMAIHVFHAVDLYTKLHFVCNTTCGSSFERCTFSRNLHYSGTKSLAKPLLKSDCAKSKMHHACRRRISFSSSSTLTCFISERPTSVSAPRTPARRTRSDVA
ncbi:uncharacterized protein M421DRAFT_355135 [Didymella exigua CBS 183.55]|uniref:Uncharacterized protein n=1 Tax=Didymella exigua CBS 183.55 TaxID=1150837 RepID=A0A6A5R487_9PLEO|nr:uncharacterized protein M421DRAFT_355135 [Didymella exigua CBS 183.55]KAF1922492.1 hypothetical protein M421DRAFT_355135 [Didymella exigua CBS 183.55]